MYRCAIPALLNNRIELRGDYLGRQRLTNRHLNRLNFHPTGSLAFAFGSPRVKGNSCDGCIALMKSTKRQFLKPVIYGSDGFPAILLVGVDFFLIPWAKRIYIPGAAWRPVASSRRLLIAYMKRKSISLRTEGRGRGRRHPALSLITPMQRFCLGLPRSET